VKIKYFAGYNKINACLFY